MAAPGRTLIQPAALPRDFGHQRLCVGRIFAKHADHFGHVHRAYNPGPGATEVWVTYVVPKDAALIIPSSAPACVS